MAQIKSCYRISIALVIGFLMNTAQTVPLQSGLDKKSALDLIILHNNDMHAHFEQTDQHSSLCDSKEMDQNKCYGGMARISYVVKDYRKKADEDGPAVLFLNAGDTYSGTPWFTIFTDQIVSDFMNILKPDASTLGNHELDLGVRGLVPFLNNVTFPVLAANIKNSADHIVWQTAALKRSVVFVINEFKVGVIGYLTPEVKFLATKNDLEFISEIEAINDEAEALKNTGVKIIIALGHSGYKVDQDIAKNCPLVDVVVGAHSHTFLYSGKQPDIEEIVGPYPTVIKQSSGKRVPVVQAYAYTKYLGKLELSFDADGNVINWAGAPILLNASIKQDPETLALLEKYRPKVVDLTTTVIGNTKVHLNGDSCRKTECNFGNMVADALIHARVKQHEGEYWTDAAVCFIHSGAIRTSIKRGKITKFDLITTVPFEHSMLLMSITGAGILQVLEHSVEQYNGNRGRFLQMSGVRVIYDMKNKEGDRVKSVEILCADCEHPHYSKLDFRKVYGVILPQFLYDSGDDYSMLKDFKVQSLNITETEAVRRYVEEYRTVYPVVENRTTMLNLPAFGTDSGVKSLGEIRD
ncbi:protein 5NUC-like [Contarinia nasturtii]|uniref:protein 5NUC-like n=1 Tax=Contarinia nasturtii TaxID=265458 RepID=UPI0012D38402|nr:protein 5NUC-like [Contarinia nasturtii]